MLETVNSEEELSLERLIGRPCQWSAVCRRSFLTLLAWSIGQVTVSGWTLSDSGDA